MNEIRKSVPALLVLLLILGFAQGTLAQTDPPERVARLNFIAGAVSYLPSGGDENEWAAAVVNRPLTAGDQLWADANSRGELHIGSTTMRINSNTGISFLNLDDTTVQIRLSDGSMNLRLRHLDPDETYEVNTPNLAFAIKRAGDYRIEANPDNNTSVITVFQGEGEVIGGGRSWQVISDQQAIFTGMDTLDYDLRDAGSQPISDFDRWARSRDDREDRVAATQHVSTEMTGYEDLDAYGSWNQVPEYGWSWRPSQVPAGWAPYRFGNWVWISPWGWTWIEDEPWGFAPFHYGRWANYRNEWIWVPGPMASRPVYAPALVAWVGGGGVSLSIGLGGRDSVGWFPLGPREVFVPSYRVSERYVTNINVTNTVVNRTTVVNIFNNRNVQPITYVNRAAPSGVTVVPHETFVNARPVAHNVINVPSRELDSAPISRAIQITPERTSVYGTGNRNAPHPPAQAINRPVVVKQTPPPAPSHFEQPQIARPDRPPNEAKPQRVTPPQRAEPSQRPPRQVAPPPQAEPPQRQPEQVTPPPQAEPPQRPPRQVTPPPKVEPPQTTSPQVKPDQQRETRTAPTLPNQGAEKSRQGSRPLVKPAPPVHPPTPEELADTQTKQKAWEKAHQRNSKDQKDQKDQKDGPNKKE
jgi:hypothetical protein